MPGRRHPLRELGLGGIRRLRVELWGRSERTVHVRCRRRLRERGEVEQAVDEPGRVAEQRELLLEVDVDAAEEDAPL